MYVVNYIKGHKTYKKLFEFWIRGVRFSAPLAHYHQKDVSRTSQRAPKPWTAEVSRGINTERDPSRGDWKSRTHWSLLKTRNKEGDTADEWNEEDKASLKAIIIKRNKKPAKTATY